MVQTASNKVPLQALPAPYSQPPCKPHTWERRGPQAAAAANAVGAGRPCASATAAALPLPSCCSSGLGPLSAEPQRPAGSSPAGAMGSCCRAAALPPPASSEYPERAWLDRRSSAAPGSASSWRVPYRTCCGGSRGWPTAAAAYDSWCTAATAAAAWRCCSSSAACCCCAAASMAACCWSAAAAASAAWASSAACCCWWW